MEMVEEIICHPTKIRENRIKKSKNNKKRNLDLNGKERLKDNI